jgi:glycine dehydrogenase
MSAQGFVARHIGPNAAEIAEMLGALGLSSLEALTEAVVPASIRRDALLDLPPALSEEAALARLREYAGQNKVLRSYLGMGYHGTHTPGVILRNVLENPGWYTAYTPYQAEIAQGRLEALLVFQTMVQDLTGMAVSNASLLDEATAAAEAMAMARRIQTRDGAETFFVAADVHPHTRAVVETRAEALGWKVVVGDPDTATLDASVFGALLQYPGTDGRVGDVAGFCARAKAAGVPVVVATDLLALTLLTPPGELGADMVVGNTQRFGVPMGYGGPHAAFLATSSANARKMPGRIIGVSRDNRGKPALRMSLQTREQHIRRAKATSNVCTAQVLLAVVAAMYAVYHGPEGLKAIAGRVRGHTSDLVGGLRAAGLSVPLDVWFDTVPVSVPGQADAVVAAALARGVNLRRLDADTVVVAFDETVAAADVDDVLAAFGAARAEGEAPALPAGVARTSPWLTHPTFHRYRAETEMLRYLWRLQGRDLSLCHAMIPLGSCTMKLNATTEMASVTWPEFGGLHPFCPPGQAAGYKRLIDDLDRWLSEVTGFAATSLQPNAGSQGEYAGLLVIRGWHRSRGDHHRDVCLIPVSAHGTNPASAVMAGMEVVEVACDERGNVRVDDLKAKAAQHADRLAALMITYPSTHGVFEESVSELCAIVHAHGGQVYMDGANMNAQVGLCRPGDIGADVCHLNLHKTFCIPHGGGGPGMGPICVAAHLAPFLPGHPLVPTGGAQAVGAVSAAPFGSPSILPISWAYIAMMGAQGLREATQVAILSANYIARRLKGHYETLYAGANGLVAHECILDPRPLKDSVGIEVDDIAKRLMDYGFHGPTMSFPVSGTLMIEPTESEAKFELDRFIEAMIGIRDEIRAIEDGRVSRTDNVLKGAPHTADVVGGDAWTRAYPRSQAGWPTAFQHLTKLWPYVGRVDNVWGDRNLVTSLSGLTGADGHGG